MSFIDNTTWTGLDSTGFYSKALLTGETKSKVKLFPNVKSKLKVASFDLTNILQEGDCSFADGGNKTLAQKTIEVCDLKVNLTICKNTIEQNYLSAQMRAGNQADIPQSFQDYLLEQVAANVSADLETLIWQGDTSASPADVCDGWLTLFDADNAVLTVSAGTLSASNILAEIAKVYNKIPDTIINDPNLVIFVNNATVKFYKQAITAAGSTNYLIAPTNDVTLTYLGIPLMVAPGLPNDVMVAASTQNLWFATDMVSDFNDVKVIDMYPVSGARELRFAADFKFGVQYGVSEEIVYYS